MVITNYWDAGRKQIEKLCTKHNISIKYTDKFSHHLGFVNGYADWSDRSIECAVPNCLLYYMIVLHEIGHLVAKNGIPKQPISWLFNPWGEHAETIKCELAANRFVVAHSIYNLEPEANNMAEAMGAYVRRFTMRRKPRKSKLLTAILAGKVHTMQKMNK